jgi:hypothetical protein
LLLALDVEVRLVVFFAVSATVFFVVAIIT